MIRSNDMARCTIVKGIVFSFLLHYVSGSKQTGNCSSSSVHHFPKLELPGGVAVTLIITLLSVIYLFLILIKVCDGYFVSTIKVIGKKIGLSSDVAGATLMAAAVSSPDLFINLIATFVTEGDIGIGTVVGCGLFNTLAVPALCILLSSETYLRLNGWSLTRDTIFYCVSLTTLAFSLKDNEIDWTEGLGLLIIYCCYILLLVWNTTLRTKTENCLNDCLYKYKSRTASPLLMKSASVQSYGTESIYDDDDEITEKTMCRQIYSFITFPIDITLKLTIPKPTGRRFGIPFYPITFIVCLCFIAVVSYVIAWMITIAGFELKIPDSLVGLTFVAIGMSIPESASSVIVARRGDGAMALSNSMGSSIFDVLVCLGLPWLLRCVVKTEHVFINSKSISYTFIILLTASLFLYVMVAANRFRLNKTVGLSCLLVYIIFALFSFLMEANIFFIGNLPFC